VTDDQVLLHAAGNAGGTGHRLPAAQEQAVKLRPAMAAPPPSPEVAAMLWALLPPVPVPVVQPAAA